jgi:hypothetical protein
MQQRHASANKALFSNLHVRRQTYAESTVPLPPVDRMRYTEQACSYADNCVLANTDRTLG